MYPWSQRSLMDESVDVELFFIYFYQEELAHYIKCLLVITYHLNETLKLN